MGVINLYAGGSKHQLQDVSRLLDRANQALQTLERYKVRLEDAMLSLTSAELEDAVSLRDVAAVLQRGEMVLRIAEEIETMIVELGVEARLLRLQLDEMYGDIEDELDLVITDYIPAGRTVTATLAEMAALSDDEVLDLRMAAAALHREDGRQGSRPGGRPARGCACSTGSRLSDDSASRIVEHFGGLARLQRATVPDLMEVDGVDDVTAASIKETLQRVTETAILDQYS